MKNTMTRGFLVLIASVALAGVVRGQSPLHVWTGDQLNAQFPSVGLASDIDGDGVADIFLGAPSWGANNAKHGRAHIYSGATGTLLRVHQGDTTEDHLGGTTALVGDQDADGMDDYVVSASGAWTPLWPSGGKAHIYSGATGALIRTHMGEGTDNFFGGFGTRLGDLDDDGVEDYALVATSWNSFSPHYLKGRVYIYSGGTGQILRTHEGEEEQDSFGRDLANLGDLDQDGYIDYGMGADYSSPFGRTYVYSGREGLLLYQFTGSVDNQITNRLAGVGDVDGDQIPDFIVGAVGALSMGRATVYSGVDASVIYDYFGEQTLDGLGGRVSAAGDVNADGAADFLVSAGGAGANNRGRAYLYSGKTGGLLHWWEGEHRFSNLGILLSPAGDPNQDGYDDFLIADNGYYVDGDRVGRAYLLTGSPLFLQAEPPDPAVGAAATLALRGGEANAPAALFLTALNGTPIFLTVALSTLDTLGDWTLTGNIPATIAEGTTLTFTTLSLRGTPPKLISSQPTTVTITAP